MSVIKRGNTYWAEFQLNGKRIRRSCKTGDRKAAEKLEAKWKAEVWAGEYQGAKGPQISLGEAFERAYRETWAQLKSAETFQHNWKSVAEILGERTALVDINRKALQRLVEALLRQGRSPSTCNRRLALVSRLCALACEWGDLEAVPSIPWQKESKGRIRVITEDEVQSMVSHLRAAQRDDVADLVLVLLDTGCRLSEVLSLAQRDIDLGEGWVAIWENKADKPKLIPLTKRALDILKARADLDKPFGMLTKDMVSWHWTKAKERMGLADDDQFVPHALRHTCASRLVSAGADLLRVKEYLGHKSYQTTLRYAHLAPEALRDMTKLLEK